MGRVIYEVVCLFLTSEVVPFSWVRDDIVSLGFVLEKCSEKSYLLLLGW